MPSPLYRNQSSNLSPLLHVHPSCRPSGLPPSLRRIPSSRRTFYGFHPVPPMGPRHPPRKAHGRPCRLSATPIHLSHQRHRIAPGIPFLLHIGNGIKKWHLDKEILSLHKYHPWCPYLFCTRRSRPNCFPVLSISTCSRLSLAYFFHLVRPPAPITSSASGPPA